MKTILKLAVVAVVFAVGIGCGGPGPGADPGAETLPACADSGMEQAFVGGCTKSGTSSTGYCYCAFNNLAASHDCNDFGNISVNEINAACRACGGGC